LPTFGQYLVDTALPEKYRGRGTLTKTKLHDVLLDVAKNNPDQYGSTVTSLKRLGDELATLEGMSLGLDDIATGSSRNTILAPYVTRYRRASGPAKEKVLLEAQNAILDYTKKHPGSMNEMVRSGGRGSTGQLMKIVGGPVLAREEHDRITPWLIEKNYAEGLKPSDAWVAGNEARINTIKSNLAPADSGDFAKILVNNMGDKLITMPDCGTKNGIALPATDPAIIDRYLAVARGSRPAGSLITPSIARRFDKNSTVIVRSPMTCQAPNGVCQKCQGLSPTGKNHPIGTNVGMRAAQALAEPLTQFALNAKHGGRVTTEAGKEKRPEGITGIRQLLEMPKSFLHRAVLAQADGKVTRIEKAPQGGHYIWVDAKRLYADPGLRVTAHIGQRVEAGDALTDGIPKPDDIVRLKGLGHGRAHLVDMLHGVYQREAGGIDRRHLETLASSVMNHVKITDPGDENDGGFVKGDVINYNRFHAAMDGKRKNIPLKDAVGETLAHNTLHFTAGTRITPSMRDTLKARNIRTVDIATTAPQVAPVVRSASRTPLMNPDWMARLAHRYLKESLMGGAHRGDISDVSGTNPIPAYAAGATFGQGKDWRY
jgi:DNA-directed RNA polymerase subunit beta'